MGGYLRLTVCLEHLTVLIIIKRVFALYGSPVRVWTQVAGKLHGLLGIVQDDED